MVSTLEILAVLTTVIPSCYFSNLSRAWDPLKIGDPYPTTHRVSNYPSLSQKLHPKQQDMEERNLINTFSGKEKMTYSNLICTSLSGLSLIKNKLLRGKSEVLSHLQG